MTDRLTNRQLNRTLLHRQFLLERSPAGIAETLEHLVGMQAQEPWDPYFGLWSRLRDFDPHELGGMIERFETVRVGIMRGTIHLVTAADARLLRGAMGLVMEKAFRSSGFARQVPGVDLDELVAAGAQLAASQPVGRTEFSRALADKWPEADADSLGYAVTFLLPLVQAPPRAVWGKTKAAKWLTLEDRVGPVDHEADLGEVVLRYLRSHGPAAPKDVRAWSYRTGLREAIDELRPQLRSYRSEAGAELLDVEDGPILTGDEEAPVRFLPQFDNSWLGFEDRRRILPEGRELGPGGWRGLVLVDGFGAGSWRFDRTRETVDLDIEMWSAAERSAVESEAVAMLAWAEGERAGEVRIGVES